MDAASHSSRAWISCSKILASISCANHSRAICNSQSSSSFSSNTYSDMPRNRKAISVACMAIPAQLVVLGASRSACAHIWNRFRAAPRQRLLIFTILFAFIFLSLCWNVIFIFSHLSRLGVAWAEADRCSNHLSAYIAMDIVLHCGMYNRLSRLFDLQHCLSFKLL